MRIFKRLGIVLAAAVIVACAGLTMDTPAKKLAGGYTLSKTIAETTDQLYLTKQISKVNALNVKASNDLALNGLDIAGQMIANKDPGADAKLLATIAILTALQDQLLKQKALVPALPASGVK